MNFEFFEKRVTSSVYAIAYLEHAQLLHRRLSAECTECGCLHLHSGRHSRTSNPEMSCTECGCLHLHSVRHSPTSNPKIGVYRVRVLAFAQRLQFPHIKSCNMVSQFTFPFGEIVFQLLCLLVRWYFSYLSFL